MQPDEDITYKTRAITKQTPQNFLEKEISQQSSKAPAYSTPPTPEAQTASDSDFELFVLQLMKEMHYQIGTLAITQAKVG